MIAFNLSNDEAVVQLAETDPAAFVALMDRVFASEGPIDYRPRVPRVVTDLGYFQTDADPLHTARLRAAVPEWCAEQGRQYEDACEGARGEMRIQLAASRGALAAVEDDARWMRSLTR